MIDLGPLYQDYAYGYPHKTAYRGLTPPVPLRAIWADEPKDRLFLYVHLPFCEMRCGFCNLFTTANAPEDRINAYLAALSREMTAVRDEIGPARIVQMAIGGGTPTLLGAAALDRLFDAVARQFDAAPSAVPTGIETSPDTATPETIRLLSARGIDRISIGVQSFIEAETRAMGRPQKPQTVRAALDTIRAETFNRLNIDLIYGAENQTAASFGASIREALRWAPEEIYLYPLYVRRGTGLDGKADVADEHRRQLYRAGRDLLLEVGYVQNSMRAFRLPATTGAAEFSCQEDGVIGLGAGARSYTATHHYATDYAVSRKGVLGILDDYAGRDSDTFRAAHHGMAIAPDERARRFVLKSILRTDGLDGARFAALFGEDVRAAFPVLVQLFEAQMLADGGSVIRPTAVGLEQSDAIPPLFYSGDVRARMTAASIA
jgi:oxygen-independent coproporphyrinogen III oxidase